MTVVCLGDSTTAGTPLFQSPLEAPPDGAGDERSQYAYWLRQARPSWEIINCGINGQRSDEIAARFDRDVAGRRAGAVIIIAGVNDVYQGRDAAHVTQQLDGMYRRAGALGIPVIAGSIVPYNTATPDQNARMRAINAWIAGQAAARPGLRFVDTRAATAAAGDPDRLAGSPDGLHPDVDGYRRMAEALLPALDEVAAAFLEPPRQ
jgi:lysophospholipase L1-like esterase